MASISGAFEISSLPLMGIGNPASASAGARHARLITPHGDRKPPDRAPCAGPAAAHYPSWGSETRSVNSPAHSMITLITPHGDRKRVVFDSIIGSTHLITPHGDRKPVFLDKPTRERLDLITPHGDRKHWHVTCGMPGAPVSLPLMGIGNCQATAYTCLSIPSLPLMGIGNPSRSTHLSPQSRYKATHSSRETPETRAWPPAFDQFCTRAQIPSVLQTNAQSLPCQLSVSSRI